MTDNAPPRLRRSSSATKLSSESEQKEVVTDSNAPEETAQTKPIDVTRQLRRLLIDNTGKFLQNWNPDRSQRKTRKLARKIYNEGVRKHAVYDDCGVFKKNNLDFCDCLEEDCPGCHFPCPKCNSSKCGHECRNNRRWTYDYIEIEGSDVVIKNKYK